MKAKESGLSFIFYIYYFTCLVFLQASDHVLILDVLKLMFGWCNLKKYLMHMGNANNNVSILYFSHKLFKN